MIINYIYIGGAILAIIIAVGSLILDAIERGVERAAEELRIVEILERREEKMKIINKNI